MMKRNSYANGIANYHHNNKNQMVKEFLDCNDSHSNNNNNNNGDDQEDQYYMMNAGFPWPPRSYTCSFCRKEFKSAQALGGHMNVHRRDRARLRQSPPPPTTDHHAQLNLNLNLNPTTTTTTNPNNLSSSTSTLSLLPSSISSSWPSHHSSTTLKPAVTCTLPLFVSPSSSASPSDQLKRSSWVVVDGTLLNKKNPLSTNTSKIAESLKKGTEILRMDLEIGLAREYDLDLELRLGNYS